jgi:transcription initiation factor IIF auxiliary subunit
LTNIPLTITISNASEKLDDDKSTVQWYKWTLTVNVEPKQFLDSDIDSVVYNLHPSFTPRHIRIVDKEKNFELTSKGWGEFYVKVEIVLKDKRQLSFKHYLSLADTTGKPKNQTVYKVNSEDFKKARLNLKKPKDM